MISGRRAVGGGWIASTPRWTLLCGFWIAQGVCLWAAQGLLFMWAGSVDGPGGRTWGEWPAGNELWDLLTDWAYLAMMIGVAIAVAGTQALFVWPVRKPGVSIGRGRSLQTSLATAGLLIGILTLALFWALLTFLTEVVHALPGNLPIRGSWWTVMGAPIVLGWAVATPLLIAFSKPGRREDLLSRLSRRLLAGTMLEVVLIIPLDVMVRRQSSCYCGAGTYWGLTICGAVGLIVLGPAVLCPLLTRRRRAWYGWRCGVCGYDMRGNPGAARCPECGTGWREPASSTRIDPPPG